MDKKKKLFDRLNKLEAGVLGTMISVAVIVIFLQIIMRYFFNNSLSWSEELARYLFIWFSWLGVSLGQQRKEHIAVTMVTDRLKPLPQKVVYLIRDVITLAILVALVYYGVTVASKQFDMGVTSTAIKIPMYLVYSGMPIGCALMAIRVVYGMFNRKSDDVATGSEGGA
jgi:TRAP-type C4-dicarboxylate transport system permease small subunit